MHLFKLDNYKYRFRPTDSRVVTRFIRSSEGKFFSSGGFTMEMMKVVCFPSYWNNIFVLFTYCIRLQITLSGIDVYTQHSISNLNI